MIFTVPAGSVATCAGARCRTPGATAAKPGESRRARDGGGIDDQRVDAGAVEHMDLLRRGEEAGQRHAHPPVGEQREVPQRPLRAVVERERDATRTHRVEEGTARGDGLGQAIVGELPALAPQCGPPAMADEAGQEGFRRIRHGAALHVRTGGSDPRPRGRGPHPGSPPAITSGPAS